MRTRQEHVATDTRRSPGCRTTYWNTGAKENQLSSFFKISYLSIFPYKSIREQSWPCYKIGQGQLGIVIWTNFIWPSHWCCIPNWKVISLLISEKIFEGFLPYMGMAAILVTWPGSFELSFPHPFEAPYEIWLWLAQRFLSRRCWKMTTKKRRSLPILQVHPWA